MVENIYVIQFDFSLAYQFNILIFNLFLILIILILIDTQLRTRLRIINRFKMSTDIRTIRIVKESEK